MKIVKTTFDIPNFGKKIRDARFDAKKNGKSLKDICVEVGMSSQNWYLLEKDVTQEISEEMLSKIEAVLNVDLKANFNLAIALKKIL